MNPWSNRRFVVQLTVYTFTRRVQYPNYSQDGRGRRNIQILTGKGSLDQRCAHDEFESKWGCWGAGQILNHTVTPSHAFLHLLAECVTILIGVITVSRQHPTNAACIFIWTCPSGSVASYGALGHVPPSSLEKNYWHVWASIPLQLSWWNWRDVKTHCIRPWLTLTKSLHSLMLFVIYLAGMTHPPFSNVLRLARHQ